MNFRPEEESSIKEDDGNFGTRILKNIVSRFLKGWNNIFSNFYNDRQFLQVRNISQLNDLKGKRSEEKYNIQNCNLDIHDTGQSAIISQSEPKELYFKYDNHRNEHSQELFVNSFMRNGNLDESLDHTEESLSDTLHDLKISNLNDRKVKCDSNSIISSSLTFSVFHNQNEFLFVSQEFGGQYIGSLYYSSNEKSFADESFSKGAGVNSDINIRSFDDFDIFKSKLLLNSASEVKGNCNFDKENVSVNKSKYFAIEKYRNQIIKKANNSDKFLDKNFILNFTNMNRICNLKLSDNILASIIMNNHSVRRYELKLMNFGKIADFCVVTNYMVNYTKIEKEMTKYILWLQRKMFKNIEISSTNLNSVHNLLLPIELNEEVSCRKKQNRMYRDSSEKIVKEKLNFISNKISSNTNYEREIYLKKNNSPGMTSENKNEVEIQEADLFEKEEYINISRNVEKYDKSVKEFGTILDRHNGNSVLPKFIAQDFILLPNSEYFTQDSFFPILSCADKNEYLVKLKKSCRTSLGSVECDGNSNKTHIRGSIKSTKRKIQYQFDVHKKKPKRRESLNILTFDHPGMIILNENVFEKVNSVLEPTESKDYLKLGIVDKYDENNVFHASLGCQNLDYIMLQNTKTSNTKRNCEHLMESLTDGVVIFVDKKTDLNELKKLCINSADTIDNETNLSETAHYELRKDEKNKRKRKYRFDVNEKISETIKRSKLSTFDLKHFPNIKNNQFFISCIQSKPEIMSNNAEFSEAATSCKKAPKNICTKKECKFSNTAKHATRRTSKRIEEKLRKKEKQEKIKFDSERKSECLDNDMKSCSPSLSKMQFECQYKILDITKMHFKSVEYSNYNYDDFTTSNKRSIFPRAIKSLLPANSEDILKCSTNEQPTVSASSESKIAKSITEANSNECLSHTVNYSSEVCKLTDRNDFELAIGQNLNLKTTQRHTLNSKPNISACHKRKREYGYSDAFVNKSEADDESSTGKEKRLKVNHKSNGSKNNYKRRDKLIKSESSHQDTFISNGENYHFKYEQNFKPECKTHITLSKFKSKNCRSLNIGEKLFKEISNPKESLVQNKREKRAHIKDFHSSESHSPLKKQKFSKGCDTAASHSPLSNQKFNKRCDKATSHKPLKKQKFNKRCDRAASHKPLKKQKFIKRCDTAASHLPFKKQKLNKLCDAAASHKQLKKHKFNKRCDRAASHITLKKQKFNKRCDTAAQSNTLQKSQCLQTTSRRLKQRLNTLKGDDIRTATIDDLLFRSSEKSSENKSNT